MGASVPRGEGRENVVVRRSRIHGSGLFARRDLQKGERVIEYVGQRVTKGEGERRTLAQAERGKIYVFELNQRHDIDGAPLWNVARYANHSCAPNCETDVVRGRIWVIALRNVRAGDEITYDYNFDVDDDLQRCRCGAAKCRRYIVGSGYKRKLDRRLAKLARKKPLVKTARAR